MKSVTLHEENNSEQQGHPHPPTDLAVLVPIYCPGTDNIYPIVRLRRGQNLSPQKLQLFTAFTPENFGDHKNHSHKSPTTPVKDNEVLPTL